MSYCVLPGVIEANLSAFTQRWEEIKELISLDDTFLYYFQFVFLDSESWLISFQFSGPSIDVDLLISEFSFLLLGVSKMIYGLVSSLTALERQCSGT